MKLITRESTIRFQKVYVWGSAVFQCWQNSVKQPEPDKTRWNIHAGFCRYFVYFWPRLLKVKILNNCNVSSYLFFLTPITPLPSPISLNLYIKSIPQVIICRVLFFFFFFFYKVGGGKTWLWEFTQTIYIMLSIFSEESVKRKLHQGNENSSLNNLL